MMKITITIDTGKIKEFVLNRWILISILLLIGGVFFLFSGSFSIPYTFRSGETISASEMNENFSAIETEINSIQDDVDTLQTDVTTVESEIFNGFWNHINVLVLDSSGLSTSYTTLDLSGTVGSNYVLLNVLMETTTMGGAGGSFYLKNSSVDASSSILSNYAATGTTTTGTGMIETDSDGTIEVKRDTDVDNVKLYIMGYIK